MFNNRVHLSLTRLHYPTLVQFLSASARYLRTSHKSTNTQNRVVSAIRRAQRWFDALRWSNNKESVPVDIFQKLQGDCHITALHTMLIYRQLHTRLQHLQTHKIDVILLKGVFLAQMVYRDVGLRPMSHIDLMVRLTDVV